ncbi:MAG: ComF family protein [Desulfuromonadales bacterium]|nr:ComF family protein [Desulfuromonadales bacterium]
MSLLARLRPSLLACLDLLLPPVCLFCGSSTLPPRPAPSLCAVCRAALDPTVSACRRCETPFHSFAPGRHLCQTCLCHPPAFSRVYPVGLHRPPLQTAIHGYKYREQLLLADLFGRLMSERLLQETELPVFDLVVPVPLHARRLRQRGYNQALELARPVARRLAVPCDGHALQRVRATPPQQGLNRDQRRRNLRAAFRCRRQLPGAVVLLVDDVMTSGATADACSRALLTAGADEVHVAVLARA